MRRCSSNEWALVQGERRPSGKTRPLALPETPLEPLVDGTGLLAAAGDISSASGGCRNKALPL